jgi:hypothetical protein
MFSKNQRRGGHIGNIIDSNSGRHRFESQSVHGLSSLRLFRDFPKTLQTNARMLSPRL